MVTVETATTSPNYTPAARVPATFGHGPRRVSSITVHHWGVFGQTFDAVVRYLCRPGGASSAHYVAQDGRAACIVDPDDAAWHAGSALGNTTSVGIECRPEATDGDYATVAALVAQLRAVYGDVPLVPHSSWKATACPGRWDLPRLDALARTQTPTPAPAPVPDVPQEDTVTIIRRASDGAAFVVLGGRGSRLVNASDMGAYQAAGAPVVQLSDAGYAQAEARYLTAA